MPHSTFCGAQCCLEGWVSLEPNDVLDVLRKLPKVGASVHAPSPSIGTHLYFMFSSSLDSNFIFLSNWCKCYSCFSLKFPCPWVRDNNVLLAVQVFFLKEKETIWITFKSLAYLYGVFTPFLSDFDICVCIYIVSYTKIFTYILIYMNVYILIFLILVINPCGKMCSKQPSHILSFSFCWWYLLFLGTFIICVQINFHCLKIIGSFCVLRPNPVVLKLCSKDPQALCWALQEWKRGSCEGLKGFLVVDGLFCCLFSRLKFRYNFIWRVMIHPCISFPVWRCHRSNLRLWNWSRSKIKVSGLATHQAPVCCPVDKGQRNTTPLGAQP